jgi:5'-nucleotidase / UDP-sugar diphosphatase
MTMTTRRLLSGLCLLCSFSFLPLGAETAKSVFTLELLHVNDTHSKFEPSQVKLTMDLSPNLAARSVYVEMGGLARLASAIKAERARSKAAGVLVLHGGDLVQGTLYYTRYEGLADVAFWNLLGLDACVLGNHEFDKGPAKLKSNFLDIAKFDIVSANVDLSADPVFAFAAKSSLPLKPYVIKRFGREQVGVIGLTTPETAAISSPGDKIVFSDAAKSAQAAIDELAAKGVNKIVILSHLGYAEDAKLAGAIRGVDVIVGGHSHTALGDFSGLGLSTSGEYPTVTHDADGNTALVVQAWEWGKFLGELDVAFDAKGNVQSYSGRAKAVIGKSWMRIYDLVDKTGAAKRVQFSLDAAKNLAIAEFDGKAYSIDVKDEPNDKGDQYDAYKAVWSNVCADLAKNPAVLLEDDEARSAKLIAGYSQAVTELKAKIVSESTADLNRGFNSGPGPIIADAMRAKTGAEVALTNPGGVRVNIPQGPISVAMVYELLPFGNTLVRVDLTGADLVRALEDGIDFSLANYGSDLNTNPIVYESGLRFDLDASRPRGGRVRNVRLVRADGSEEALDPAKVYKVVVNSFIAGGGDHYDALKAADGKIDTGFNDAEAFMEYIGGKTLKESDPRINVLF